MHIHYVWFCRYSYQLPPGQPNHTCGGANIWADVGSSSEIFCSAGSYCPTTVQKNSCSSGYYFLTRTCLTTYCFLLQTISRCVNNQVVIFQLTYSFYDNLNSWRSPFCSFFLMGCVFSSFFRHYCRMGSTSETRKDFLYYYQSLIILVVVNLFTVTSMLTEFIYSGFVFLLL